MIAIEMMHRDLGETFGSMEERLADIGITLINPADILTDVFKDESVLELSKICRIENSQYSMFSGKKSWDYFGTMMDKPYITGYYRDCVGKSVDVANTIIIRNILNKSVNMKLDLKLCAYDDTEMCFICEDPNLVLDKDIFESVVIRAFGRQFEVNPVVKVF